MLTAMKVVGGLIVFFAAVWAYLILKLIVNSLTGRMKTKMKLAYMFGWMPGLNLVVIPTVMFRIFTTSNFITQKLFTDLSVIESIGNTLNLSFASGGVFGFYAGVGLIAVAIVRFILKGALSGVNEYYFNTGIKRKPPRFLGNAAAYFFVSKNERNGCHANVIRRERRAKIRFGLRTKRSDRLSSDRLFQPSCCRPYRSCKPSY